MLRVSYRIVLAFILSHFFTASVGRAQLAKVFTDHMVIQQERPVRVWQCQVKVLRNDPNIFLGVSANPYDAINGKGAARPHEDTGPKKGTVWHTYARHNLVGSSGPPVVNFRTDTQQTKAR